MIGAMPDQKPTLAYRRLSGPPRRGIDIIVLIAGWLAFAVGLIFLLACAATGIFVIFGERIFSRY
jgi:hypothetical protein